MGSVHRGERTARVSRALFLVGSLLLGPPVLAEGQSPEAPAVKAAFRPVKKEFVFGEAIKVLLEMENLSKETIDCYVSPRVSDFYRFEVRGKRFGLSQSLKPPEPGDAFVDMRRIDPGDSSSFYCMLQEFCALPGPDTYNVAASAVVSFRAFRAREYNHLPVESRFEIVVKPTDLAYLAKRRQELFVLCNSGDVDTATKAFREFKYILGDQAIPLLRKLLESDQCSVHYPAIDELARIGSKEALDALTPALRSPLPDVRQHLAQSLWRFGKESISLLSRLTQDRDPEVRRFAARVLAGLRVPEAIRPLSGLLLDENALVRSTVLSSLTRQVGMIRKENAADPLRAKVQTLLAQEKDEEVLKAARAFLEALEKPAEEGEDE